MPALRRKAGSDRRLARAARRGLAGMGLCLAAALPAAPALAQPAVPADAPRISLLTFAPGDIYWQRFGHNALLVRDPLAGETRVYNYGIFDFQQKNFLLNFARGQMLYRLDTAPLDWTLRHYAAEGRETVEQQLGLAPAQRRLLADYLSWNAQPENADYRYDYFTANCSTRVRDAIDRALGGALRTQLQARAGTGTYRSEVLRLMAPLPGLMLGMDLGLGPRVDRPIDQWQEGFIPMRLRDALRAVQIVGEDGALRPLVLAERVLIAGADDETTFTAVPVWPFALAGFAGAGLLLGLARGRGHAAARALQAALSAAHALICGLAGVVLALGWAATAHWGMAANHNLLLLNPLWLLLVPAALSAHRARAVRGVALLLGVSALLALAALPLGQQPNLHWLALLLPLHAAVLAGLLRRA